MANNLYDYLNQFTLGQAAAGGRGLLQGAADVLNRYGIGTRGTKTSQPQVKRQIGTQAVLGGKPVYWGGNDYGWQQLNNTGASATLNSLNNPATQSRFIQDPGFRPLGGTPEERAQAAEASRIAQLTAQDPELQRYEAARLKAVAPGATPEQVQSAEDIGMQIWAQKYGKPGGLASKVKPGQSGYDTIQRSLYDQGALPVPTLEQMPEGVPTLGPSPLVPQVDQSLNPASPNFIGGEGRPLANFADPRFENISPEEFQKLLNAFSKK